MASENVKRFAVKSDSDIDLLLKEAVPMNTRKSTDMWVGVFQKFCKEQDIDLDLATCSATELNSALCKFYPSLRMKSGGVYRKASYLASRGAIHRKTQELKRSFNLFKSEEFTQSHRVLDATLKANKEQGLEPAVKHKEALTIEDRKKVQAFFADVLESNDPVKLTMYVWYAMTMHFGLRGHEVQVRLKKSDLEFKQDDSGEFVVLSTDFASKNCPGGIAGREFATVGRVNDPRQVAAMRLLLEKVHPDVDRIFQRARTGPVKETDKTWFTRQALGHNLLGSMIERISERAGLSKKYTNHCVRATAVTILKENGVEDRKVCLVTGHKSEKSLEHYNRPTTSECSDLAQYLDGKDPRKLQCRLTMLWRQQKRLVLHLMRPVLPSQKVVLGRLARDSTSSHKEQLSTILPSTSTRLTRGSSSCLPVRKLQPRKGLANLLNSPLVLSHLKWSVKKKKRSKYWA